MAEEQEKATIYDFIIPQKVDAFCTFYEPSQIEVSPGEAMTDSKLRKFFGCMSVIKEIGDPLQAYILMLAERGFNTNQVSITGEWAIFVQPRVSGTVDDLDCLFGGEELKEIESQATDFLTETN